MRKITVCAALILTLMAALNAQQTTARQTARQALLEMFFSKTPGTFAKHLPVATLAALEKAGSMQGMQQYSLIASQLESQSHSLQTFETGPLLLSVEDAKTGGKFEIRVENEALHGDQDDIEVSFRIYKDGQEQHGHYMPRMTFSMKQEAEIWKLNEISFMVHIPLADPDLLKALTEKMKPQPVPAMSAVTPIAQSQPVSAPSGSDAMVLGAMRRILAAETTYAATYPAVGYTCMLSDLDGFGSVERNEHQAMLIDSGLASGKRYGFVFAVSGCGPSPAASFHVTAVPGANVLGRKAFCADQSNVIRSSDDGNAATCLTTGTPVQ